MNEVLVYPAYNANYYSYYLCGIETIFKSRPICYTTHHFPRLHSHCLAFQTEIDRKLKKIYISAGDGTGIHPEGLAWCDLYAKINVDPLVIPTKGKEKIFLIGPSFGIQYFNPIQLTKEAILSFSHGRKVILNPREHIANYYRQWKYRLPIDSYNPGAPRENYIFFAASLWKNESANNKLRANFVRACRSNPELEFEGGFSPRSDLSNFKELFIHKRYRISEYITKTKQSLAVFNTPANQNCLGWKLGEFLALGKAIISTPLKRPMPVSLVHGTNIHYVSGTVESILEAIHILMTEPDYRQKLERGARQYFLDYLAPSQVLQRIVEAVSLSD